MFEKPQVKIPTILASAYVITLCLLAFMADLIDYQKPTLIACPDESQQTPIESTPVAVEETKPQTKTVKLTKPSSTSPSHAITEMPSDPAMAAVVEHSELTAGLAVGQLMPSPLEPPTKEMLLTTNDQALPLVRIPAKYPAKAALKGVEGWVKLMFDVDTRGRVKNIRIVSAEPKRVFEQAARAALTKWRYRPANEGIQKDLLVQLDFVM